MSKGVERSTTSHFFPAKVVLASVIPTRLTFRSALMSDPDMCTASAGHTYFLNVARLVPNQSLSHLAPGRVSRTDDQHPPFLHNRRLRHSVYRAAGARSRMNVFTRS